MERKVSLLLLASFLVTSSDNLSFFLSLLFLNSGISTSQQNHSLWHQVLLHACSGRPSPFGQLKSLGDDPNGCYFTIVCGSSASLPLLLEAKGDYIDKSKFHLELVYGNKCRPFIVTNPPPNSLETVRGMINGQGLPVNQLDVERLIREGTFLTGGNARLLTAFLRDTKRYHDSRIREDGTHIAKLTPQHNKLRDAIYRQLAETHQQDLKDFINGVELDVAAITETQLNRFRPITDQKTLELCNTVLPGIDDKRHTQLLNDLADHGYVTIDGEDVYPKTIFSLAHFARKIGIVHWQYAWMTKAQDPLATIAGWVAKNAAKASIQAAATVAAGSPAAGVAAGALFELVKTPFK